ncbi:hypothetical protein Pelo_16097 [Pelomyxa schiedti]|nr:hypothetical protein Pelo_16097 [Pelomyxa schiedti]
MGSPMIIIGVAVVVALVGCICFCEAGTVTPPLGVYPQVYRPEQHPQRDRFSVAPPTWDTFQGVTHFATLRGFSLDNNGNIVDYKDTIELYSQFGDILWPFKDDIFAPNLNEVVDYVASLGMYITDIWGFVPGSGPGDWEEFTPPPEALEYLEAVLGSHWLGMDVGEQDGRYIGGYSTQTIPLSGSHSSHFLHFHYFFDKMETELGGKVAALTSLYMPHYLLQSGRYTVAGCETAQALPNTQLFYSFTRGACKRYGILWFGNVSIYNRWGYKTFLPLNSTAQFQKPGAYTCNSQNDGGTECGPSLALMKRLMYSQIFYNSAYVSMENGWLSGTEITSAGSIQKGALEWISQYRTPGIHLATIGVMLDFFQGYVPPRHLYSGSIYRNWGTLPYDTQKGDYFTDELFRLVYPGYQDSSYFHSEAGFTTPTPYGDSIDILLHDAPQWLINRYDTIIVTGTLEHDTTEIGSKLSKFMQQGGHVILTSSNLAAIPGGLGACTTSTGSCFTVAAKTQVLLANGTTIVEPLSFTACPISCSGSSVQVLAQIVSSGTPVALQNTVGDLNGTLIVLGPPTAVSLESQKITGNSEDSSLSSPHPIVSSVRGVLDLILTSRMPFRVSSGLTWIACRNATKIYTLLVSNPTWGELPMNIESQIGAIASLSEIPLDQSEKNQVGYVPDGYAGIDLGSSTATTIAGGDTRVFKISLQSEDGVKVLSEVAPESRLFRVGYNLLKPGTHASLRNYLALSPIVSETFDTAMVDWTYIAGRSTEYLQVEGQWLASRKWRLIVDASSGIDLYPGDGIYNYRLCNNSQPQYSNSFAGLQQLITKMGSMGVANDLLLTTHRVPENNYTPEQTHSDFAESLRNLISFSEPLGIHIHLRYSLKNDFLNSLLSTSAWAASVHADLRVAIELSLASYRNDLRSVIQDTVASQGGIILVAGHDSDVNSGICDESEAILQCTETTQDSVGLRLTSACSAGLCLTEKSDGDTIPELVIILDGVADSEGSQQALNDLGWVSSVLAEN